MALPAPASDALMSALQALRWVRVDFVQVAMGDVLVPAFTGPVWRSVFGQLLERERPGALQALERRGADGRTAQLYALHAPWADVLTDEVPNGPPAESESWIPAGQALEGSIALFGPAADELLPAAIRALAAFGQRGIGTRGRYVPLRLLQEQVQVTALDAAGVFRLAVDEVADRTSVGVDALFVTPTQLTRDGRPAVDAPSFHALLRAGRSRLTQLLPSSLPREPFAPGEITAWDDWAMRVALLRDATHVFGGERYSRNQDHVVPLRGIIGQAIYGQPATHAWPWLRLIEHLQLGKKTTHGQGVVRFRIRDQSPSG